MSSERASALTKTRGWTAPLCALLGALTVGGCAGSRVYMDPAEYFDAYQQEMLARGLFRTELRPADAPYGDSDLVRHFERVVFDIEENLEPFYRDAERERRLSRWEGPIVYELTGDGVRPSDPGAVADVAAQLAAASGLEIRPVRTGEKANLEITLLTQTGRARTVAYIEHLPGYEGSMAESWLEYLETDCIGSYNTSQEVGGEILSGAVYIKAEIEDPLRRGCFVEEMAQLLGLPFDHADVRPSIFNDDEEFLFLTEHDLALIAMLYDKRLKPGMSRAEARALLPSVVKDKRRAVRSAGG